MNDMNVQVYLLILVCCTVLKCCVCCSHEFCPKFCQGCNSDMDQPYKMPCGQHHIGECCKEEIMRERKPSKCPVDGCDCKTRIHHWIVDKKALENR